MMCLRRIITDLYFNHTLFLLHHVLSCKDKGTRIERIQLTLSEMCFCLNAHLIFLIYFDIDYKNGYEFIYKPERISQPNDLSEALPRA